MWKLQQKKLVHVYARAAGLSDPEYRHLLAEVTGATSARDSGLTQHNFEQFMARLEAALDYRVAEGFVERPNHAKIQNLNYWRRRLPAKGDQNSRQVQKWSELWRTLKSYLPIEQQTDNYLTGIACQACGARISTPWQMTAWQASLLIDALADRLHYAIRRGEPVSG